MAQDMRPVRVHVSTHTHTCTHTCTDSAVQAHLLLWQSELIPSRSRRPGHYFSLWVVFFVLLFFFLPSTFHLLILTTVFPSPNLNREISWSILKVSWRHFLHLHVAMGSHDQFISVKIGYDLTEQFSSFQVIEDKKITITLDTRHFQYCSKIQNVLCLHPPLIRVFRDEIW